MTFFVLLFRLFFYIYYFCYCLFDKGYYVKKVVDIIRVLKKILDKKKEGFGDSKKRK